MRLKRTEQTIEWIELFDLWTINQYDIFVGKKEFSEHHERIVFKAIKSWTEISFSIYYEVRYNDYNIQGAVIDELLRNRKTWCPRYIIDHCYNLVFWFIK